MAPTPLLSDIRRYSLPQEWPYDEKDIRVLYIRCSALQYPSVIKDEFTDFIKSYGAVEDISIHLNYAVVKFKTKGDRRLVKEGLVGAVFKGSPLTVGVCWYKLSRGRRELIEEHSIHHLQVNITDINSPGSLKKQYLKKNMSTHGKISYMEAIGDYEYFEFDDLTSVISALAVESEVYDVELDKSILKSLAVKPSIISLVYNINTVAFSYSDLPEFDESELKKLLGQYGPVVEVIKTSTKKGVVTFFDVHDASKALGSCEVEKGKYKFELQSSDLEYHGIVEHRPDTSCFLPVTSRNSMPMSSTGYAAPQMVPPPQPMHQMMPTPMPMQPMMPSSMPVYAPPPVQMAPLITVPPPSLPWQPTQALPSGPPPVPNHVEIICTMPSCLDYSKLIRNALLCQDLRVGVLNPSDTVDMTKIIAALKTEGVAVAIFVDEENAAKNTFSVKYLERSNVAMKDLEFEVAIFQISKFFNPKTRLEGYSEKIREMAALDKKKDADARRQELKERSATMARLHQEATSLFSKHKPELDPNENIKTICKRIIRGSAIHLRENTELINFFTEQRSKRLEEEYQGYVPSSLKHPPVGPFGDTNLKNIRKDYESITRELITRNLPEELNLDDPPPEDPRRDPLLKSALSSLMSMNVDQLKSLVGTNK